MLHHSQPSPSDTHRKGTVGLYFYITVYRVLQGLYDISLHKFPWLLLLLYPFVCWWVVVVAGCRRRAFVLCPSCFCHSAVKYFGLCWDVSRYDVCCRVWKPQGRYRTGSPATRGALSGVSNRLQESKKVSKRLTKQWEYFIITWLTDLFLTSRNMQWESIRKKAMKNACFGGCQRTELMGNDALSNQGWDPWAG